jgi:hypothetical protein
MNFKKISAKFSHERDQSAEEDRDQIDGGQIDEVNGMRT